MRRTRDRFFSEREHNDNRNSRFGAPEMYSSEQNTTAAHTDGQMSSRYLTSTDEESSQNVGLRLKELRTMSFPNSGGRIAQNVASYGNGAPPQRNFPGMENSGRPPSQDVGQHHRPQAPPFAPSSSVSFPPSVPPPTFDPSLPPPPGFPPQPPFRAPHPPVQPNTVFNRPPPPPQPRLPFQGVGPSYHPQPDLSGSPVQTNQRFPQPSKETGFGTAPVRSRPPPPQNIQMTGPSENIHAVRPGFGPAVTPPQNRFLPPPSQRFPHRLPSPNLAPVDKSVSGGSGFLMGEGSVRPMPAGGSGRPAKEEGDSGTSGQVEVNRWLKKRGKWEEQSAVGVTADRREMEKTDTVDRIHSRENKITLSIGEAQDRLRSVLHALAGVQGELQQLEQQQGTADTATWEAAVCKIRQLKKTYLETKQSLDIREIKQLKRKVDQRRKKRERCKRRREEAEQQAQFEHTQKHAAIDQWSEQLRQKHETEQQMKKMKETADKTLSKVRRDIRETRKMMDTVSRLQKLRAIRNDTAEKRGQTFPPSVANHFSEKTDDLIQLLSQQVDAFEKEEAALKLILETENEEAKEKEKEEKRQKERVARQREMAEERQSLFGTVELPFPDDRLQPFSQYYYQAQCSLQSLHNIRRQWDSFLVSETTALATRIPDGWVTPEPPSSSVWASALHTPPS